MELGDAAHKDILLEDYEKRKRIAKKLKDRGEYDTAATYFRKSASLLDDVQELEGNDAASRKYRTQAAHFREVADKLEAADPSADAEGDGETEPDASGPDGRSGGGEDGSSTTEEADDEPVDASQHLEEPPALDFDDVGGMTDLKQTLIDKVVDPLDRKELYEEYDLGVVNAVLLYGPPGTGKTYVTRALAGKLGYNFIDVEAGELSSSLVGEAAKNVGELFEVALDNQPCLVFVDEIDAIAPERTGGHQKTQSEHQMITTLLTNLTAIKGEDVIFVSATNLPDAIDQAAWSRFEERIEVPPPDAPARGAILRVHLRDRPVLTDEIDWDRVKALTEGYTARDLSFVAENAARAALDEAKADGDLRPITQDHLERAVDETTPSLDGHDGYSSAG
jgi:transitional endoplasmic reticulum ATPase